MTALPPCPTSCDPDCTAPCHEIHAVNIHKRGHQPHGCKEIREAIAAAVAAERERIRQLAIERDAEYVVRRTRSGAPRYDRFADLIGGLS